MSTPLPTVDVTLGIYDNQKYILFYTICHIFSFVRLEWYTEERVLTRDMMEPY